MATETFDKKEILQSIDEEVSQLLILMSSLNEEVINDIPYKDSWTAGQLFRHVAKSVNGMAKAMGAKGKPAERDPGEKIPELKKQFLDFLHKMKSPDFVVPEKGPYQKQAIVTDLKDALGLFKENTNNANLVEIVQGLPLGEITKLEILHFVLYHTQRHLHQMRKICQALQ